MFLCRYLIIVLYSVNIGGKDNEYFAEIGINKYQFYVKIGIKDRFNENMLPLNHREARF